MEFEFTVSGLGSDAITMWDAARIGCVPKQETDYLRQVIEEFGLRSAKAQGLVCPITDVYRLRNSDQRLYLYSHKSALGTTLLGGLKVGRKKLYYSMVTGGFAEIEPVCVLDFYVHESWQRHGIGHALFEFFLHAENLVAAVLAYDRPSPKLLAFLDKYYDLKQFYPQANKYVVYDKYFELAEKQKGLITRLASGTPGSSMTSSHGTPLYSSPPPYTALASKTTPSPGAYPGHNPAQTLDALDTFRKEAASRVMSPQSGVSRSGSRPVSNSLSPQSALATPSPYQVVTPWAQSTAQNTGVGMGYYQTAPRMVDAAGRLVGMQVPASMPTAGALRVTGNFDQVGISRKLW